MITNVQRESFKTLNISKDWTLFLDRDGVINKKIEGDYVRNWKQFKFIPGVIEALNILRNIFGKIIIVTNQRGIGRGLMSHEDLETIHKKMLSIFEKEGVYIDAIYYCPHDPNKEICNCRKPKVGMALKAKKDFPEIDFAKAIMVGDSLSDMEFAYNAGMKGVFIKGKYSIDITNNSHILKRMDIIGIYNSLYEFAKDLKKNV